MNVFLYSFKGDRRELEKKLTQVAQYSGTFKQSQSLKGISLELKADNSEMARANYAYLDALKRYYFVDDVKIDRNGFFTLKLSEDVLMSHREDIKKMKVEIVESDNPNENYMKAEMMVEKTLLASIGIANPFGENKLYMCTVYGV